MATNYTQRKAALDEIASAISNQMNAIDRAIAAFATAETSLNNLQNTYSGIILDIDSDAALDDASSAQKSEKDKLVTDFLAQKARAVALKNAVNGI
jgi:hypothetical protein